MKKSNVLILPAVIVLLAGLTFAPAQAQQRDDPAAAGQQEPGLTGREEPEAADREDRTLAADEVEADRMAASETLSKLHVTNRTEIHLGRLATEKGQSEAVRDFGQRLIDDHRDADDNVLDLVDDLDLILQPPAIPEAEVQKIQDLEQAEGREFDRMFADMMVEGHRKVIDELRQASTQIREPEVQELIDDVLPTLEEHLDIAQGLSSDAQPSGSGIQPGGSDIQRNDPERSGGR